MKNSLLGLIVLALFSCSPTREVIFTSEPPGAQVRLQGELLGATPFTKVLSLGSYQFSLTYPDYHVLEDSRSVEKSDETATNQNLHFNLYRETGFVSVRSPGLSEFLMTMDNSQVSLNNGKGELPWGDHELIVWCPGYFPVSQKIIIKKGETLDWPVRLKKLTSESLEALLDQGAWDYFKQLVDLGVVTENQILNHRPLIPTLVLDYMSNNDIAAEIVRRFPGNNQETFDLGGAAIPWSYWIFSEADEPTILKWWELGGSQQSLDFNIILGDREATPYLNLISNPTEEQSALMDQLTLDTHYLERMIDQDTVSWNMGAIPLMRGQPEVIRTLGNAGVFASQGPSVQRYEKEGGTYYDSWQALLIGDDATGILNEFLPPPTDEATGDWVEGL